MPDSHVLLDYLIATTRTLVEGLVVYPERMAAVLRSSHGLVFSQRVLLELVERGLTRELAYTTVQRNALTAWDGGVSFRDLLGKDPDVTAVLPDTDLDALFDPRHHLRHLDVVRERVEAL